MKTIIALFLALCLPASAQIATNLTLTNLSGRVYSDITLDHTNKLGFVWTKPDGNMGQIKFKDLPPDLLTNYGITQITVDRANLAEAKAADFWERKAEYDSVMAPIEAEQAKEASDREIYALQQSAAEAQRRSRWLPYNNGNLNVGSGNRTLTANDVRAAQLMNQAPRR